MAENNVESFRRVACQARRTARPDNLTIAIKRERVTTVVQAVRDKGVGRCWHDFQAVPGSAGVRAKAVVVGVVVRVAVCHLVGEPDNIDRGPFALEPERRVVRGRRRGFDFGLEEAFAEGVFAYHHACAEPLVVH